MFKMKKKSSIKELVAVVDGELIPIEEVKDPVFAQKMMGDGFAIIASGNIIYSCADAIITMLFPSNHAIGLLLDDGMEILLHVGIDTVNEKGKGFYGLCTQGQRVKRGEALLQIDRDYLVEKGYDVSVVVVFTKKDAYTQFQLVDCKQVKGGETMVATYTI